MPWRIPDHCSEYVASIVEHATITVWPKPSHRWANPAKQIPGRRFGLALVR